MRIAAEGKGVRVKGVGIDRFCIGQVAAKQGFDLVLAQLKFRISQNPQQFICACLVNQWGDSPVLPGIAEPGKAAFFEHYRRNYHVGIEDDPHRFVYRAQAIA